MLWDALFPDTPILHIYGLYLKGTWISKVEPQFKEYKYSPDVLEHVMGLWNWISHSKSPAGQRPVKTSFRLDFNKLLTEREELVL